MEIIVETEEKQRIDQYLKEKTEYSRSLLQKMIDEKCILLNGKSTTTHTKVKSKDRIEIIKELKKESTNLPEDIPLDIVFENENVLLINKPSGMVVHPGSGNHHQTLVNAILGYTDSLSDLNGEERPGIVHRIDKDTSGLIMIAKTNKVHELLSEDFKNKRIKREYIALLNGVFKNNSATIDAPIGRDKNNREKMTVTAENSKNAITHLKVLKRYKNNTLVSCILDTGRTHQIRVHMAYIGFPVHNDPVYSKDKATEFGQFLHSYKMHFIHPITKKEMDFTCPLPKYFTDYLDELEEELN